MASAEDEELELYRARVGSTLRGKWRIDALLGVGGMAAVYAATHKIGRRDAIKILHPQVAVSKDLRARFEQEALAVGHLGHRGTVQVLDIDTTEDGAPFMVMELLEGESLGQRAHRLGAIPERELLELARTVLEVLEIAHERGIVHRDIKPDNLFVTTAGQVKVLDFGIAQMKQGGASSVRTRTGAMLGTTAYMPPEQIVGGPIDGRADLFAVGATLFRIIAQRRIHEATTDAELLVKMGTQSAPPLRSVAPHASEGLGRVVDHALAFAAERRYPSARAMREDVEAVLAGQAPPHATSALAAAAGGATRASVSSVRTGHADQRETGAMVHAPTIVAMQAPTIPDRAFEPTTPSHAVSMGVALARPSQPQERERDKKPIPIVVLVMVAASMLLVGGLIALFFVVRATDAEAGAASRSTSTDDGDEDRERDARPTPTDPSASSVASQTSSSPSSTSNPERVGGHQPYENGEPNPDAVEWLGKGKGKGKAKGKKK
ncbi:MAG: serine/threonine-protein kinase [Polyangiaceae bacterium]